MRKLSSRGKCVRNQPLFEKDKILLRPLHINLGLMKSVVSAMNKRGKGFKHFRGKFPKLGDAKSFKLD
jgi:hypothetical protein